MSTITAEQVQAGTRLPVSARWSEAGFPRAVAETWRSAGWHDAAAAAAWIAASPEDHPHHLRRLRDAGYSADQLQHTGRVARQHVAAWTAAIVRPAEPVDPDAGVIIDLR